MTSLQEKVTKLKAKRKGHKLQVYNTLKTLENVVELSIDIFNDYKSSLKEQGEKIKIINEEISTLYYIENLDENEDFLSDQVKESKYLLEWQVKFQTWAKGIAYLTSNVQIEGDVGGDDKGILFSPTVNVDLLPLEQALNKFASSAEKNKLEQPKFHGTESDIFAYCNFKKQFEEFTEFVTEDVRKLRNLKNCLKSSALKLISHLPLLEDNYAIAIKILDAQYLNKFKIRKSFFDSIFNSQVKVEDNYKGVIEFVNNMNSNIQQLQNLFVYDFSEVNLTAEAMISHVLFHKFPAVIKERILAKVENSYPTWGQVTKHIPKIIEDLINVGSSKVAGRRGGQDEISTVAFQNATKPTKTKFKGCFFCGNESHSSGNCPVANSKFKRQEILKSKGYCGNCANKHIKSDTCILSDTCKKCNKSKHHAYFCFENLKRINIKYSSEKQGKVVGNTTINPFSVGPQVALPTIAGLISIPGDTVTARLLLDSGSQKTLVLNKFVKMHNLKPIKKCLMKLQGFQSQSPTLEYNIHEIPVLTSFGTVVLEALEVDTLPQLRMNGAAHMAKCVESKGYQLADKALKFCRDGKIKIDILVGSDFLTDILNNDLKNESLGSLLLLPVKTGGFSCCGKYYSNKDKCTPNDVNICTVLKLCVNNEDSIESFEAKSSLDTQILDNFEKSKVTESKLDLAKLYALDSIGVFDKIEDTSNEEILKYFNDNIKYIDNLKQYQVPLILKTNPPLGLPENFGLARGRFKSLCAQIDKRPKLREQFHEVCMQERTEGIIEQVPYKDLCNKSLITHYIPQQLVEREGHPTTPIRRVFDCSAKTKGGISLNDQLEKGPNMVPKIFDILIRNRYFLFILICDVSRAFLRILLSPEYRDLLRFFVRQDWRDPNSKILIFRFCSVLFGSSCSPFLLQATILFHLKKLKTSHLGRNLFVDDLFCFVQTLNELFKFQREATDVFSSANLPLTKFATNSEKANKVFLDEGLIKSIPSHCEMLGVKIEIASDKYVIKCPEFAKSNITLRILLSNTAQVFEPQGIFQPCMVQAKMLISKGFSLKVGWDTILGDEEQTEWLRVSNLIKNNLKMGYKRCVIENPNVKNSLHVFSDASAIIYGCCAYNVADSVSNILCAKARVKPQQPKITIPKMELLAACLGAQLIEKLILALSEEVTFSSIHLWVDASIILYWICSNKTHDSVFIRNRVNYIRTLSKKHNVMLHKIGTECNPADLVTKANNIIIHDSSLWMHGPECLYHNDLWIPFDPNMIGGCGEGRGLVTFLPTVSYVSVDLNKYSNYLPNPLRFSNLFRLLGATFRVFEAAKFFSSKLKKINYKFVQFDSTNFILAEKVWIKELQSKWFISIIDFFRNHEKFDLNIESRLTILPIVPFAFGNLAIVMDSHGFLRVHTRMNINVFSFNEVYPYLIPKKDYVSILIVRHVHTQNNHTGSNQVCAAVRSKYWIVACRPMINEVIKNCTLCKKMRINKYQIPDFPALPEFRLTLNKPFEFCGIDLTGCFHVKSYGNNIIKRYIVLFTCSSTRAVHLLIVKDNSSKSFIHAFAKHCYRYGNPKICISDNAANFKNFDNLLNNFADDPLIKETLAKFHTTWKFIPSRSPWMGGWWERLIGLVKNSLKKSIGKRLITIEQFETFVAQAEYIVNQRPLSYISSNDTVLPLSPQMLLNGQKFEILPYEGSPLDDPDFKVADKERLTNSFKRLNAALTAFQKTWNSEYIDALKTKSNFKSPHNNGKISPKLGDVVCIIDEKGRISNLSRILDLKISSDNCIRSAKVLTKMGTSWYPLCKLTFLECSDKDSLPSVGGDVGGVVTPRTKYSRSAANVAKTKIRNIIDKGCV